MLAKYLPKIANPTAHELLFAQGTKLADLMNVPDSGDTGMEEENLDFLMDMSNRKFTRRLGFEKKLTTLDEKSGKEFEEDYQITYRFTHAIRKNPNYYGISGWSCRMLYEFLCENYNEGVYFVDTYFDEIFPHTSLYQDYRNLRGRVENALREKVRESQGVLRDKMGRFASLSTRELKQQVLFIGGEKLSFKEWATPVIKAQARELSNNIRLDIIDRLSTGQIRLSKNALSPVTIEQRQEKGIYSDAVFYATGEMIENIKIYVRLDSKEKK